MFWSKVTLERKANPHTTQIGNRRHYYMEFSFTKTFSPACSMRQHWIMSSAGARKASPVFRLKYA
jgi:hypothetical protein